AGRLAILGRSAVRRLLYGLLGRPAPIFTDVLRHFVAHREGMIDNRGLAADQTPDAAIAVRKPAAELVHRRVLIGGDDLRVVADERAREDAVRPTRKIVALHRCPEHLADISFRGDLLE